MDIETQDVEQYPPPARKNWVKSTSPIDLHAEKPVTDGAQGLS